MIHELTFPALSPTMSEGTLVAWRVKPGDSVKAGQVLAEIQTDKAIVEWESPESGTVRELLIAPNQVAKVNSVAAILTTQGEDIAEAVARARAANERLASAAAAAQQPPAAPPPAASAPPPAPLAAAPKPAPNFAASAPPAAPSAPAKPARGVRITPVAARLAAAHDLDLTRIRGTGPDGRIVRVDVERALADGSARRAAAPAASAPPKLAVLRPDGADQRVPFTPMRAVIAQRLAQSKQLIPHFAVEQIVDAAALVALREQLNRLEGLRVTINDLIVRAAALALRAHPRLNATCDGQSVTRYDSADIAVAVALPDGLITPIVFKAHAKSVRQIGEEIRQLVKKAQEGRLQPAEFQGGTFTVSNLGASGVASFSAIINPPQVAILAVAAIRDEPVVRQGQVVPGKTLRLTVSADHRAVDGADVAAFLQTLRELLENPATLLA
ncbi:MAG: 2-oxo acid dehydrogenase subunit E2 [Planctomycetes bacterium]|nr:2-oxo acid dehydrogenase subunit E2 [Planctomycetota bacterium]